MRPRLRPLILTAVTLVCVGCAGGTLGRIGGGTELPKELPKEMKERFEIKDVPVGQPSPWPASAPSLIPVSAPSPAPSPAQKAPPKKPPKKKKGKTPETAPSPEPVTVYPNRRPPKDPIWLGEKATYGITYFGMEAGLFTLEALPFKSIADRKVYHIRGTAESAKLFNLFYRLNDQVETFIDYEGLFSHRFHLLLDESKQSRDALELNDSIKQKTYYWNRWKHVEKDYVETKEFQPIVRFPQDSLSALYYIRTVPLPPGKVFSFPVVSEGHMWEAIITVVRRETMDTPLGRVQCVVLKPDTKYQGVLQKRGDSYIWLTDDERRHLIRLEAKVKIGTVVAELKRLEPGNAP
jgi:hypothetical protein